MKKISKVKTSHKRTKRKISTRHLHRVAGGHITSKNLIQDARVTDAFTSRE